MYAAEQEVSPEGTKLSAQLAVELHNGEAYAGTIVVGVTQLPGGNFREAPLVIVLRGFEFTLPEPKQSDAW